MAAQELAASLGSTGAVEGEQDSQLPNTQTAREPVQTFGRGDKWLHATVLNASVPPTTGPRRKFLSFPRLFSDRPVRESEAPVFGKNPPLTTQPPPPPPPTSDSELVCVKAFASVLM